MTTPSEWDSLSPWDQAREWLEVDPGIARVIIDLGQQRAQEVWKREEEEAIHIRQLAVDAAKNAQEIERMEVEGRISLDRSYLALYETMERRAWILQIVAALFALLAMLTSLVIVLTVDSQTTQAAIASLTAGGIGAIVSGLTSRSLSRRIEKANAGRADAEFGSGA